MVNGQQLFQILLNLEGPLSHLLCNINGDTSNVILLFQCG